MSTLPQDPIMLYSAVNMKLRDMYTSLDELCNSMNVSKDDIENKLRDVGFEYDKALNQFR